MTEKAQEHDVLAELAKKIETLCNEVDLDFILKEIPDAISQSRSGLAQVSKIVLAMKDFAHPGTADKSSYDINRAIETAITISHNQWKHVAEISMDLDQSLLMAECHPDQLNQVFLNLIVNASHAIESVEGRSEPGLIKLSTRLIDSQIVISVEDNGIGIPDTVINKIFDPFFTTKEVGRGTGQGLSIAYDIVVNKHAGTLQVASEIGKGTTFTIGLPVHESRVQKNPNIDLTERGDDIGTNP
jgi:two-component system, NtrC family, sensor kinase